MTNQNLPVVAIVGRPNVGKSSLFNRLAGRRVSIVHRESGVTRDRVVSPVHLAGRQCLLTDTGGLGVFADDGRVSAFDRLIRDQVEETIREADCLIWVVDSRDGITALDREFARLLRRGGASQVIVAVNKADNAQQAEAAANEFAALDWQPVVPISCSHGRNLQTLVAELAARLPLSAPSEIEKPGLQLAVVGRPNVGKSSLVNALLGEPRVMVSDIAGTTRDAVDIPITVQNDQERALFTLIDTAGLRRKRRVDSAVELFSVMRAENAIKRSQAVVFVVDAGDTNSAQDRRIARLIESENKPCIIVANKWDLAGRHVKMREMRRRLEQSLPFMQYAPIIGVCAVSGYNLQSLLEALFELRERASLKIPTAMVNQFVHDVFARTPPPAEKRGRLKFFYGTMVGNPPPQFLLFVNDGRLARENYRQYLKNQLQSAFFPKSGLPVSIRLRSRR